MQQGADCTFCFPTLLSLNIIFLGGRLRDRGEDCRSGVELVLDLLQNSNGKLRRKGKVRKTKKRRSWKFYVTSFWTKREALFKEVRQSSNRWLGPEWRCHLWHRFDSRTASSLNRGCPPLCVSWLNFYNTDGVQEEVGREKRVKKGASVLHSGWFICCVRSIWARAFHHERAFLRVVEEAQLQRGLHQEGGAQLSAATGKIVGG